MTTIYFMIFLTFIISVIATPIVIKISVKLGLVDIPKDSRRVHAKPMPRVGGLAIITSIVIGLAVYYFMTLNATPISQLSLKGSTQFLGYILGAFFIALMGIIDDAINLRARYKFIFQVVAVVAAYLCGIRIEILDVPFLSNIPLDFLSLPITGLWIIGISCAVNLIDGLDGLAAGISSIASFALLMIFTTTSASIEPIIITSVLLGALLGFLPYNFNPAKTFMGDVGSNFIGYTISVVSIIGFAKGYTILAVIVPILALGVPVFDTLFAMVRRIAAGKPPLQPDGAHIHHRLLKRGLNQRQAVYILYTITSLLCIISVLLVSRRVYKIIILVIFAAIFITLEIVNTLKAKKIKKLMENIDESKNN